jgi:hypothetical protein
VSWPGPQAGAAIISRAGLEASLKIHGMAASLAIIDSKQEITNHVISTAMWLSGTTVGFSIALPAGTVGFRLTDLNINVTTSATVASTAYGITTETASSAVPLSAPTGAGPSVLFPICKPVEAASTTVPWKAVRSTAVGALFSNVTAVMNKEGTIKCARVSSESTSCLAYQNFDTAIDTVTLRIATLVRWRMDFIRSLYQTPGLSPIGMC